MRLGVTPVLPATDPAELGAAPGAGHVIAGAVLGDGHLALYTLGDEKVPGKSWIEAKALVLLTGLAFVPGFATLKARDQPTFCAQGLSLAAAPRSLDQRLTLVS